MILINAKLGKIRGQLRVYQFSNMGPPADGAPKFAKDTFAHLELHFHHQCFFTCCEVHHICENLDHSCVKLVSLAVQDSSIGDLVSQSMSDFHFDFSYNDYNDYRDSDLDVD